jgi:Yip1 domain
VTLESVAGIAYAPLVLPEEQIRPLHDVWLRPRRVFRELATRPIGAVDYLLGAAQGIAGWLAFSRSQNAGVTSSVAEIFLRALLIGTPAGIASLFLLSTIYARIAIRAGRTVARNQVFHVVAYGGVPLAASLVIWVFAALLIGEVAFEQAPHPEVEGFVALLLRIQFIAYILLTLWSVVIQVMGLSEIQGIATRKAFGLWVLGQVIAFLALFFLMILVVTLFPGAVTT